MQEKKQNEINTFVWNDLKKKHSRNKCKPQAGQDIKIRKTRMLGKSINKHCAYRCPEHPNARRINTESRFSSGVTKKNIQATETSHRLLKTQMSKKTKKRLKMTPFRKVPTARKCHKKQYEFNIFVLNGSKRH